MYASNFRGIRPEKCTWNNFPSQICAVTIHPANLGGINLCVKFLREKFVRPIYARQIYVPILRGTTFGAKFRRLSLTFNTHYLASLQTLGCGGNVGVIRAGENVAGKIMAGKIATALFLINIVPRREDNSLLPHKHCIGWGWFYVIIWCSRGMQ